MQKITKKKAIVLIVVILSIVVIFTLIRSCSKNSDNVYEYAEASIGDVKKTISVPGMLEVLDSQTVISKTAGIVVKVYVDYNQNVAKGQTLAIMDSSDIDQNLIKIGTQLESANLELLQAKDELEGKKNMYKDKLISQKGMELAEYKYKSVALKHKQILVDYNIIKKQKNDTRIIAPISGIIISREIDENQLCPINKPLFIIAPNLKDMKLIISVDESDIGQIKKEQHVEFTVSAFPEKSFYGKIDQVRINPIFKGGLVTYESVVICQNKDNLLKPGMTATAIIEVDKKMNVVRIPNQAFIVSPIEFDFGGEKKIVWRKSKKLMGNFPVEPVEVETGLKGDKYTEIKKKIKKGDKVLIKFIKNKK